MLLKLMMRFGATGLVLLLSLASIVASVILVFVLDLLIWDRVASEDLILAVIIPAIVAPLVSGMLVSVLKRLHDAQTALRRLAERDPLTGLVNRRHFLELARREWQRVDSAGSVCSVLLLDVDCFKTVNDRHGHAVGDLALQHVARICSDAARDLDAVARYGGEEFVALLVDADLTHAAEVAERIRATMESTPLICGDISVPMTLSIGVAARTADVDSLTRLLAAADAAMYASKAAGRNRVTAAVPAATAA